MSTTCINNFENPFQLWNKLRQVIVPECTRRSREYLNFLLNEWCMGQDSPAACASGVSLAFSSDDICGNSETKTLPFSLSKKFEDILSSQTAVCPNYEYYKYLFKNFSSSEESSSTMASAAASVAALGVGAFFICKGIDKAAEYIQNSVFSHVNCSHLLDE